MVLEEEDMTSDHLPYTVNFKIKNTNSNNKTQHSKEYNTNKSENYNFNKADWNSFLLTGLYSFYRIDFRQFV